MSEILKFGVKNYRLFKHEQQFCLKPVTIITGPNNSGKSSLINFLSLLSSGFKNSDFPLIDLRKEKINVNKVEELISFGSSDELITFFFTYYSELANTELRIQYNFTNGDKFEEPFCLIFHSLVVTSGTTEIFRLSRNFNYELFKPQYVSPFERGDESSMIYKLNIAFFEEVKSAKRKDNFRLIFDHFKDRFNEYWIGEIFPNDVFYGTDLIYKVRFLDVASQFFADELFNLESPEIREKLLFGDDIKPHEEYSALLKKTKYKDFVSQVLSPFFNEWQKQIYRWTFVDSIKPDKLFQNTFIPYSTESSYLSDANNLLRNTLMNNNPEQLLFKGLSLFGRKGVLEIQDYEGAGFTVNYVPCSVLKADTSLLGSLYNNVVLEKNETEKVVLSSFGSGFISICSIILRVLSKVNSLLQRKRQTKASENEYDLKFTPIILLEEPEAFLHPAWQSKLAELLILIQKYYKVNFIIETHSEYIIRKLQYLIAKNKIKPEDLIIYYFHAPDKIPKGEKQVKEMKIRKDGMMDDDFGEGFFDESIRLTIDLLNSQNKN